MNFIQQTLRLRKAWVFGVIALLGGAAVIISSQVGAVGANDSAYFENIMVDQQYNHQVGSRGRYNMQFTMKQGLATEGVMQIIFMKSQGGMGTPGSDDAFNTSEATVEIQGITVNSVIVNPNSGAISITLGSDLFNGTTYSMAIDEIDNPVAAGDYMIAFYGPSEENQTTSTSDVLAIGDDFGENFEGGPPPPGFGPPGDQGCQENDTVFLQGTIYEPDGVTPYTPTGDTFMNIDIHTENFSAFGFAFVDSQTGMYRYCAMDQNLLDAPVVAELRIENSPYGAPAGQTVTLEIEKTRTLNFTLVELVNTVSGTLKYSDTNAGVANAEINFFSRKGQFARTQTDENGAFSTSLAAGTYEYEARSGFNDQGQNNASDWIFDRGDGPPPSFTFENNTEVETVTLALTASRTDAKIKGRILQPNGTPSGGGFMNAFSKGSFGGGMGGPVNFDGNFEINVIGEKEYELQMWIDDPTLTLGRQSAFVKQSETKDLGDLVMRQKTECVNGRVVDESGTGIPDVNVDFFQGGPMGGGGFTNTQTGSDGAYSACVDGPGEWMFHVMTWGSNYLSSDRPTPFRIEVNQTKALSDITLYEATSTITLRAVDTDGNVDTDIRTFSACFPQSPELPFIGGEVNQGKATLKGIPGIYKCTVFFDFGEPKSVLQTARKEIVTGENTVDVTVVDTNVTVSGRLVDENGDTITGLFAIAMFSWGKEGGAKEAHIDPATGTYSASLYAPAANSKFRVGVFPDPFGGSSSKYVPSPGASITASPGDTKSLNLIMQRADATITGTITDNNGNPIPHHFISVDNGREEADESEGITGGDFKDMFSNVLTDENGVYSAQVLSGTAYTVRSGKPKDSNLLQAQAEDVAVASDQTVTVNLQHQEAAGSISGRATNASGVAPSQGVAIAFCDDGTHNMGSLEEDGDYSIPVSENTECTVRVEAQNASGEYLESENVELTLGSNPSETQDVTVEAQFILPRTEVVSIDVSQQSAINLTDGTIVTIPQGALGSEGTATVTVAPSVGMPASKERQALSYGIDITAMLSGNEVTSLTDGKTITIDQPYSEDRLNTRGIDEEKLTASYVDKDFNDWAAVSGISIDTEEDVVTMSTSHLTTFSPVGTVSGGTTPTTTTSTENNDIIITGRSNAGPSVRIVDEQGGQVGSFMAYTSTLRGGWNAVGADTDGDGTREVVTVTGTGNGPHVRVYEIDGTHVDDYFAYDAAFRGGVDVAVGDVNADGRDEIITAPMSGAANVQVYGYNPSTEQLEKLAWKMVYDTGYTGGVSLAAPDLDGDGYAEVLVVPKAGASNLRAYSYSATEGLVLDAWAYVYGTTFKGGTTLAVGDVNGDGDDEVVTGPLMGSPNVRVLDYTAADGFSTLVWAFAYDTGYKGGVQVAVGDVDNDGNADVVTAPLAGAPNVRAYSVEATELTLLDWMWAYNSGYTGGVNLLVTDVDGGNGDEVVTATRVGAPNVRVYSYVSSELVLDNWFWGLPQTYTGGTNVSY